MTTKIDKIIGDLLLELSESESIDQEFIQGIVERVRKKLNLGTVFIMTHTGDNRDYSFRWISALNADFMPIGDSIHIRSKMYKEILENSKSDPVYRTIFFGKGVKGSVSTMSYTFIRSASNVMDGAVGFVSYEDHEWTEEEEECLRKLGRTLRRVLAPDMLHDTDIQLKMAHTKVDIYRHYTEYDTLTQVPNRHYFVRFCKEYVEKSKRPNVGFLFADLNRLKFINDTMGHPEGDIYITNFAEKLSKSFNNATVCRISGDEFIVCDTKDNMEEFNRKIAALQTENIYRGVRQASIGHVWMEQAENIKDVMNQAEELMYTDKQQFYVEYPQYKR